MRVVSPRASPFPERQLPQSLDHTSAPSGALITKIGTVFRSAVQSASIPGFITIGSAARAAFVRMLSCPLSGTVSSTINGTVTAPTTGTDGTIHIYTT